MNDLVIFIAGFLLGSLLGSLFTAVQHNDKVKHAFLYLITFKWVKVYTPKKGIDFKKGIRIHKANEHPKDYPKRIYPKPHPGGRRSIKIDEEAIDLIIQEKYTIDRAWNKLKTKYIELEKSDFEDDGKFREYFNDPINVVALKNNYRTRIKRKIKNRKSG